MSRKDDLEQLIRESYQFIFEYEKTIQYSDRPEEKSRSRWMIDKYRDLIGYYLRIYLPLCERLHLSPESDIVEIADDIAPKLLEADVSGRIKDQDAPYTKLPGSRIIRVGVSQMFRIADLLTRPESVKARKFYEAITDKDKMRRTLNKRITFSLGTLGSLKPVIMSPEQYDRFWKPAVPDLRKPTSQPLCFIPFELPLSQELQKLRCNPESVLDLESALLDTSESIQGIIQNTQISGRLRIYPPGVGVIQLGITLEFREAIHIEVVAQIAQGIEDLLFVDPKGLEKPCETLLLDIVNQVIEELFIDEGFSYEERRWLPPETTLSFRDDCGLVPQEKIDELAYLMALAPGNHEDILYLRNRIQKALKSPHWQREQILTVAGQGVALFFVAHSFAAGREKKRKRLQEWLEETHEMVSAAAYARQAFAEEIKKISGQRLLDDTWLPKNKEKFDYLFSLLSTMRQVMQATASIKSHLQKHGAGVLMAFADDLWTYSNPVDTRTLLSGLTYIADWLTASQAIKTNERITRLVQILEDIQKISLPFSAQTDGYLKAVELPLQEELETRLLSQLQEIGQILKRGGFEESEEINRYLRNTLQLRKQLGR